MGIKSLLQQLKEIVRKRNISEFSGQTCAVDTYSWLHKSVDSCVIELALQQQTDKFVQYCLGRLDLLLQNKIKVYLVFDGAKLPSKRGEEQKRAQSRLENREKGLALYNSGDIEGAKKFLRSSIDITPQLAFQLREAVRSSRPGVTCVVAPYEADAQMAYMCAQGIVDFVVSEDSDLLAFGAPRVFYKMDRVGQGDEIRLEDLPNNAPLQLAGWSRNKFLYWCIMCGCDYLENIQQVAIKKAHSYVSKHDSYARIIAHARAQELDRVPQTYLHDFERAVLTFRFQKVYCPNLEKIVPVNKLDLEDLHARYDTPENGGFALCDTKVDEQNDIFEEWRQEQEYWKNYENDILERSLITKILDQNFSWDFLGQEDDELLKRIARFEIDPDTLAPYVHTATMGRGGGGGGTLSLRRQPQQVAPITQLFTSNNPFPTVQPPIQFNFLTNQANTNSYPEIGSKSSVTGEANSSRATQSSLDNFFLNKNASSKHNKQHEGRFLFANYDQSQQQQNFISSAGDSEINNRQLLKTKPSGSLEARPFQLLLQDGDDSQHSVRAKVSKNLQKPFKPPSSKNTGFQVQQLRAATKMPARKRKHLSSDDDDEEDDDDDQELEVNRQREQQVSEVLYQRHTALGKCSVQSKMDIESEIFRAEPQQQLKNSLNSVDTPLKGVGQLSLMSPETQKCADEKGSSCDEQNLLRQSSYSLSSEHLRIVAGNSETIAQDSFNNWGTVAQMISATPTTQESTTQQISQKMFKLDETISNYFKPLFVYRQIKLS